MRALCAETKRMGFGFVVARADLEELDGVRLERGSLDWRRVRGDHDGRLRAVLRGRVRHAEAVVARRCGHDAPVAHVRDGHKATAHLERARRLQRLQLEHDVRVERRTPYDRRGPEMTIDDVASGNDVVDRGDTDGAHAPLSDT